MFVLVHQMAYQATNK